MVAVTLFGVVSFAYSAAAGNNSDYDSKSTSLVIWLIAILYWVVYTYWKLE